MEQKFQQYYPTYNYKDRDIVLLEFGDMKLSVPLNKFFNTDYCNLERNNNKYYNQEGIIFGTSFIQYLTYLNFDYETKQISLFSEVISIEMNNHIKASKVISIITLLICLICIVLDICLKISQKNTERNMHCTIFP